MADAVFDSVITAGAAGCAAGFTGLAGFVEAVVTGLLPVAQPTNGRASTLAAVIPKPCCKNSLREAMVRP
ncbi:hypothetical protein ASF61_08070 [Duganella sp. Leaf126]|nr:hypothetical protein ASF61_08070 [Duganella sp. Leaf126]